MTTRPFRSALAFAEVAVVGAVLATACTTTTAEPTSSPSPSGGTIAQCPAKQSVETWKPATVHTGDVQGNEVWTAEASPHLVKGDVNVRDGAKLTVAPCAVVLFEAASNLNVAFPITPNRGELVAEGTAEAPIRFAGKDGARWGNVFVHAPGTARFAYVTFSDGGGNDAQSGESTLHVRGDGDRPRKSIVKVDHVTIEGSRGAGMKIDGGASFAEGSRALVIKGSGTIAGSRHPYPLEVGEQAIDGIPTGTYTGNGRDEILVEPEVVGANGGVQEDTTMRDRGVPYRIGRDGFGNLQVGNGNFDATLTIEAGVTIKFHKDTVLGIESDQDGTSAIRALGTAEKPIVFTSAEPAPRPGDWRGFYFNGPVSPKNQLEHVRIEYTGADCGCVMVTCSAGVESYAAAIIFSEEPKTMFLRSSAIVNGSGHGVVQGYDGNAFDWTQGNSFEGMAGCAVTLPRGSDTSCPDPKPACK